MTKKDLFSVVLKLYGLYSVVQLIIQIPEIYFYLYASSEEQDWISWLILAAPVMSILVIYVLIFKPGAIIRLFKLDKGFDEGNIQGGSRNSIARIALIIISIYLIATSLGDFISQLVFLFEKSSSGNRSDSLLEIIKFNPFNYKLFITCILNLMIGFLLLTNNIRIAAWIEKINHKNAD